MNIFKEFDAILSALKPSQYRHMWQLYNYNGTKNYTRKDKQLIFDKKDAEELIDFLRQKIYSSGHFGVRSLTLFDVCALGAYIKYLYNENGNEIFSDRSSIINQIMEEYEKSSKYEEYVAEHRAALKNFPQDNPDDRPLEDIITEALDTMERIIRSHIGETAYIESRNYMEGDTLYTYDTHYGTKKTIKANPSIKHMYDSLFPARKDRIILDNLYLQPNNNTAIDNARSYGINIGEIIKGIHSAAQIYFEKIRKDKQEAEYLQEVLGTTRYSMFNEIKRYINDYFINGLYKMATKTGKFIRIGKILQAISNMKLDNSEILYAVHNFNLAKVSSTKNSDLIIILSRHPYDIAGMSTDRGWTSCMNLDTGIFKYYVPANIAGGTLIAYLCNKNDTNINRPLGRVLIKPCIKAGEKIQANPVNFILRCSDTYGTFHKSYIKQLQDWFDKHWNNKVEAETGKYILTNMTYKENDDTDWEYTEDGKWEPYESEW